MLLIRHRGCGNELRATSKQFRGEYNGLAHPPETKASTTFLRYLKSAYISGRHESEIIRLTCDFQTIGVVVRVL